MPTEVGELRRGLSDLRTGALLELMATAISLILIFLYSEALARSLAGSPSFPLGNLIPITLFMVPIGGLILASLYELLRATGHLRKFDPNLGVGRSGVAIELMGIAVLASVICWGSLSESLPGFAVALLILAAGLIGMGRAAVGLMVMRLWKIEGLDKEFKVAGTIYVAGTVLCLIVITFFIGALLNLVALVLIHTYSGSGLRYLSELGSAGAGDPLEGSDAQVR
ncbi:MAG: hypothetical protein QXP84_06045 [Candidatus Korarchaeum sp.]